MHAGLEVLRHHYTHHGSHSFLGSLIGLVFLIAIVAVVLLVRRRNGRNRSYGGPPPGGYPPPTGPTAWGNPHATYPQPAPPPPAGQDAYDAIRANPYGTAQPGGADARPAPPPPPPGDMPPGWGGQSSRPSD